MLNPKSLLFLLPLLVLISNSNLNTDLLNDPQLAAVVLNYFGCALWQDGLCTQCSPGYFFNKKGICCEIDPQCQSFNRQEGFCESCYEGYYSTDGKCSAADLSSATSQGCRKWANNTCAECSWRWYFSSSGICSPIDDLCYSWSESGQCDSCYNGYIVENNQCIRDQTLQSVEIDKLCKSWSGLTCLSCAERAYFNEYGKCTNVDDNCKTWDEFDGQCLTCYNGFVVYEGECVVQQITISDNLGCQVWDWNQQICLKCSDQWYLDDATKLCSPVSSLCATYNQKGQCTSCYKAYQLINGKCIIPDLTTIETNSCRTWDWEKKICLKCASNYNLSDQGTCISNCQQFNDNGKDCLACKNGYHNEKGTCIANSPIPIDLGCKTWDWDQQICLACSSGWELKDGKCVRNDSVCKQVSASGVCTSCYAGYHLKNNSCFLDIIQEISDVGCSTWNQEERICQKCATRWVLIGGKCSQVSDLCATYNPQGKCLSCYTGYSLVNGVCQTNQLVSATPGCQVWDSQNAVCRECAYRWYINMGRCYPVSDDCQKYDSLTGKCTSCYSGYSLNLGKCAIEAVSKLNKIIIPGCETWDEINGDCLKCSYRYVLRKSLCFKVSDQCSTFDQSGLCLTCYGGYHLEKGACVINSSTSSTKTVDPGCQNWSEEKQICLKCATRWVMKNGRCHKVSDLCATYSKEGVCLSCYGGYQLFGDGSCQVGNPLCKQFGINGECSSCYNRYALYKNNCVILNQITDYSVYLYECCQQKYNTYVAEGRIKPIK